jgi:AraC-like DNA-binding protein
LILKIERYIPTDRLRPFIKEYLFIECEEETDNIILPDTSIVMAIRYNGKISIKENGKDDHLPGIVLSGIRKSARQIHYCSKTGNLLVIFNPGGASAFFSEPLNELADLSVPADCFSDHADWRQLPEQIATADHKRGKIAQLERVLISGMTGPRPDPLVLSALQKIRLANGMIPIKELAAALYISQDAFEKRFRQTVGASPKQLSSIIRLRNAISVHSAGSSLTDTALTAGYYDQAHFIKDFKGFTGQSPGQFFRSRQYW